VSPEAITVSPDRARAIEDTISYYIHLFAEGRDAYALPKGTVADPKRARALAAYFFWSAWAAATDRPGDSITYTSNWPHEPLIANRPTADAVVWTGVSILVLLAAIAGLGFWHAARRKEDGPPQLPATDPLLGSKPTPSQRATVKYFWIVCLLFALQLVVGIITAHYGVEGSSFYGIPLAKILPYSVARTWHVQLGIFWIATAWLASGLAIAPSVGTEPRGQKLLVNVLFGALVVVVLGSLAGELLAAHGTFGADAVWWFGHSGYEYVDLGRFFQIALLVGLLLWVFVVGRSLWPAIKRRDAQRPLLLLLLLSTIAIGSFYFAALGVGRHTTLAIAEYWRWCVVHLWVEGFFEVFATVIIAFLFARLGLVHVMAAARASILAATIFLAGGVIGTLHHLYFSGTPTIALAFGSVFSALEIVPLMFLGYGRVGELAPHPRHPLDARVPLADLLLHRRRVLERRRRRAPRFHDQPAGRALLHAGPQHDTRPRTHGALWRVRNARHRPLAVHAQGAAPQPCVARPFTQARFLGDQHRARRHGAPQRASCRPPPDMGVRRARLLVRAARSSCRCPR
jgi:nitric oxide reductase subunit B